ADLRHAADPVGPENDAALMEAVAGASAVLCGWGAHGALLGRGPAVAARLRTADVAVCHLGLSRDGQPRHPLYVAYAVAPQPWRECRRQLSKSLRVGAGSGAQLTHLPSNPGRGAPAVGGRRQIAGCGMLMLAGLMGLLMVGLAFDFTGG